jgi:hypothetical protein
LPSSLWLYFKLLILIIYFTSYDIMLLVLFINVKADRDRQRDEPAEEVDQLNHATTADSHPPHRG